MPGIHDINLIPPEIIEEQMNRHRIRKWSMLIVCQIICFCLAGISFYGYLRRLEGKATGLRHHSREVKQAGIRLVSTYQGIKDLLQKKEDLLRLAQKQCFSPVLIDLARDMDPKTRLVRLRVERGKERPSPCPLPPGEREIGSGPCKGNGLGENASLPGGGGPKEVYYDLTVGGISQSYQSLSNFLLHLQQDKSFQEIRLIKSDMDEKEKSFISFEISLIYSPTERPSPRPLTPGERESADGPCTEGSGYATESASD